MSNLTPAQTQKAEDRPISFVLENKGKVVIETTLFIRPEDMSRSYPSRTSVNQTLGGAFIDSFGEGLEQTSISGITGWRSGPDGKDGIQRMIDMRSNIYAQWHDLRAKAIKAGTNPNEVKLRFSDTLNRYTRIVVPQVFEIRRNKSRPLLSTYRISFIAVFNPKTKYKVGGKGSSDPSGFGLGSLLSSLNSVKGFIDSAKNFVNNTILGPVKAFMNMSHQILTAVHSIISSGKDLAASVIGVARAIAQTGVNIFRTLAAVASIPSLVKATLMQVASAYSNIFCILKNALKTAKTYENYTGLYGASNCSSTSGGSPASQYAGVNPFYSVAPSTGSGVAVSTQASGAMNAIISSDVVLSPLSIPQIGNHLTTIAAGVKLA